MTDGTPIRPLTRADIPNKCPSTYCKDIVPAKLPPAIMALFIEKHELIQKAGRTAPGCWELTVKICKALGVESERDRWLVKAKEAGWPLDIDFDDLPARISTLFPETLLLRSDSSLLTVSPVWLKFLEHIRYKVFAFSKSTAKFESGELGCG